tara:strand:+ start:659 stop:1081 length:423 start_codon:yes stop_codon:yes gene_type:complete
MFRIRPKPKFYDSSTLVCCDVALGGRTPTEWFANDDALTEVVVDNGDGTYTTTWSYIPASPPTFDERVAFVLCCATDITISYGSLLEIISINDGDYYLDGLLGTTGSTVLDSTVLNRGACGNNVELYFGPSGSGSFSITH